MVLDPCEHIVNECARRDFDALRLARCLQFVQIDANNSAVKTFGKDFFEHVLRHGSNEHDAARSTFCLQWILKTSNRTLEWVIFAARLTRDQKLADFIQQEAQRVADDLNNDLSKSDRKNLLDMLTQLEDHWKIVLKSCKHLDELNRTKPGLFNVPDFVDFSSKLYKRPAYEEDILAALKKIHQKPQAGALAITGEGGVGKTTIMAGLFHDKDFFTNLNSDAGEERAIDTVIWLDCFQWRDKFEDSALEKKLIEKANLSISPRSGYKFDNIEEVLDHFEKRLLLCFDDVYNANLFKFIRERFRAIPSCILVRDTNELPDCNKFIEKKVNIANFSNDDVRKMLTTIYEFDHRRLSDLSLLDDLVETCCGLPLIASFIANQFKFDDAPCDDAVRDLLKSGLASKQTTEKRDAFTTLSDIFKFSVERLDEELRRVYMAVLLWEPNEKISLEDLTLLWYAGGCDLSRLKAEARLKADLFTNRGLLRKVERGKAANDTSRRYFYIVHQLLHQAAVKYFCQASDEKFLSAKEKMRLDIATGQCLVNTAACQNEVDLLNTIMINKNRELLEALFDRCDARGLAAICALTPSESEGFTFACRLYFFTGWKDNWTRADDKVFEFVIGKDFKTKCIVPNISKVGTMFQPNYSYRLLRKLINRLTSKENNEDVRNVAAIDIMMNAKGSYGLMLAGLLGFEFNDEEYLAERRLLAAALPLKYRENWGAYASMFKRRAYLVYQIILASDAGPLFFDLIEGNLSVLAAYPPQVICSAKRDEDGVTPLMLASLAGHLEVVKFISNLSHENVKQVDKDGWLPLFYAIQGGDLPTVSFLLDASPKSVDHVTAKNQTALLVAVKAGSAEIVKLLISKAEFVEEKELYSAFDIAATEGHLDILEFLHDRYPSIILLTDPDDGTTLLHTAVLYQHVELSMFLCNENADAVKCVDHNGRTPLHYASARGNLKVVEMLYVLFPDAISLEDNHHCTPLHYAAQSLNVDTVKYLYRKYPEAAKLASETGTPLYQATASGSIEIVQFFVECRDGISKQLSEQFTEMGSTCLMEAASHDQLELVKYLYKKSPQSISLVSGKYGLTALHFAAGRGAMDVVKFLYKKYPEAVQIRSTQQGGFPLLYAASSGSFEVTRYLCDIYPDALKIDQYQNQFNVSPHMVAIMKGRKDILQLFFEEYGQFFELTADANGLAMLNLAASTHNLEMVTYLCSLSPDLLKIELFAQCKPTPPISALLSPDNMRKMQQSYECKTTPLAAAILGLSFSQDNFSYFVETKSSPEEKLNAAENRMQIVKFLLEKNDQFVSFVDCFGNTPLLLAASAGQFDVVRLLYEAYPDALHIKNKFGLAPFLAALAKNAAEIIEFFYSKDAYCVPEFITSTIDEETKKKLLEMTSISDRVCGTLAPTLQSLGMTVEGMLREIANSLDDFDGITPLMMSCGFGHFESVRFLCEKFPGSICVANPNGLTAFSLAIGCEKVEIVKLLCSKDSNLVRVPILKATPLQFAIGSDTSLEILQFLCEQYPEAVDIADEDGETAFLAAIRRNRVDVLAFLHEKRNDLVKQAIDSAGSTPLHFAVEKGSSEAALFLCGKYPEALTIANSTTGMTPFLLAANIGSFQVLSCLYDFDNNLVKVKHEERGLSPFGVALANDQLLTAVTLLRMYPDAILPENNSGRSPLHDAMCSGKSEIIALAYKDQELSDFMFTLRDQDGNSLFELAVERGLIDIARTILYLSKHEENLERLIQRGRLNASVMLYNSRPKMVYQHVDTLLSELSKDVSALSSGNNNVPFTSLRIIQKLSQADGCKFFETFAERNGFETLLSVLCSVRTNDELEKSPRKFIPELRLLGLLIALSNRPTLHYLLMDQRDLFIIEITERLTSSQKAHRPGVSKTGEVAVTAGRLIAKLMSYQDSPFWLPEQKEMLLAKLSENLSKWANHGLNFDFMTLSSYDDFGSVLSEQAPLAVQRFGIWFISKNAAMKPADVIPQLNKDQNKIVQVWQTIKRFPDDPIIARFGRELARTNAIDFLKPIFSYSSDHCAPEELTNRLKAILKLAKEGEPIFNGEVASDCYEAFRNLMRCLRTEQLMTFADAARIETLIFGIVNRILTKLPPSNHHHLLDPPIFLNEEIIPRLIPRSENFNETAINAGRLIANVLSSRNLSQKDDLSKKLAESVSIWVANDLKFRYIKFSGDMYDELKPMLQMYVPVGVSRFAVWLITKNAELDPDDALPKIRRNQEMIKLFRQLVARHRSDPIIFKFGQSLIDKTFTDL